MLYIDGSFPVVIVATLAAGLVVGCAAAQTGVRTPFVAVNGPVIVGHRGAALEAPENTLAAIEHAVAVGADWQEIDVTLSADDQVVVIHDDTLERTTSGTGLVRDKTLAELKELSAGAPGWTEAAIERLAEHGVAPADFGDRFSQEKIPTLDEALAVPGSRLMIEMKRIEEAKVPALAKKVIEAVQRARAHDRVVLGSFAPELLWAAWDREPSLPLIGIASTPDQIEAMLALPVVALAVRYDQVAETKKIAPSNLAIWGWTVYSAEMAEQMVKDGAHGLITDVPQATVKIVRPPPDAYIVPGQ